MNDSAWGRLVGVLFAPEKAFRSIAERPTWLPPLLVIAALTVIAGWAVQQRSDPAEVAKLQMKRMGIELNDQQRAEMEERMAEQGAVQQKIGLVVGPLFVVGGIVVLAAILLVAFKLFGSDLSFKQSLAAAGYGLMPSAVASLINIPLILSRPSISAEQVLGGGVLVSSLRPLAPEGSAVLGSLLGSLDFFTLWCLVLFIFAYRAVARVSTATAAGTVISLWLIWVLGKLGLVAILGNIGGGS
jgi:Yip1 domain